LGLQPALGSTKTAAAPRLTPEEATTVSIFKKSTPAVVFVTNLAERRDSYTMNVMEVPQGAGSGFVWDEAGHIVTNYHVIKGASEVSVTLSDQSTFVANIIGADSDKDIAVLQIDAPAGTLTALPRGQSAALQVGQKVFAIGNPFGLDHTLTTGVISGTGREIASGNTGRPIQDIIQTDAAINPGNSGGPLLNSAGQLIGINTAIYSPSGANSGVGFALPVDTVKGIVDQLIRYGKVTRPILGISFAPDQAAAQLGVDGVLVLDAPPGGPAARAGVQPTRRDRYGRLDLGDVVTSIDGEKISGAADLYKVLDRLQPGQTIKLGLQRKEGSQELQVTLDSS
jgi:S1-C subfamily serine protease